MERQARRERESWDRFRRDRKEEGIQGGGSDWERGNEIIINGERYVKQEKGNSYSHRKPPGPTPPSAAAEIAAGDDRGRMSQILGDLLEEVRARLPLRNNPATDNQEPERKVKTEEEGVKIKSQPAPVPLWKSFLGLNLGNGSVPPPPPSSHSRSASGSNRGQTLPKRKYPKKNTAEIIADVNGWPSPSRQAYQERRSWRSERPSGVEFASPSAVPTPTRPKASYPRSYPPPPTVVTIPESESSSYHAPESKNGDPAHRVYRVPSYRMNPTGDPYSQQHPSAPTANTRRRRRRGLGEDLPTVPENWGTSSYGRGPGESPKYNR